MKKQMRNKELARRLGDRKRVLDVFDFVRAVERLSGRTLFTNPGYGVRSMSFDAAGLSESLMAVLRVLHDVPPPSEGDEEGDEDGD